MVGATLVVAVIIVTYANSVHSGVPPAIFGASLFMAVVGFADDLKSIPVLTRLVLQAVAVGAILFTVPGDLGIVPACPLWIELPASACRPLVRESGQLHGWTRLDAVVEVVPITGAMIVLGSFGEFPLSATVVAAALCGAMIGFAPFNRPVAKIFLGDVGSLPIGLLLGRCLLQLAYHQQFVAALLLSLYYLSDATLTLMRRLMRAEPFWAAHRSHYYQRATDNGFTVWRVVSEVFTLNVGLAVLAIGSVVVQSSAIKILLLVAGGVATAAVMHRFSRRSRPAS